MKNSKKIALWILGFFILYLGVCIFMYFIQERFIFHPKKLPSDHEFPSEANFEEITINTPDGIKLNGLIVKADSSKGLIFFLHGSGGNVIRYKNSVPIYNSLNYDIFLLDYRGYGKSEGKIKSEKQFFDDVRLAYSQMKSRYNEEDIVIIGFSLGTVPAAKIASENKPKLLVLEGGFYNPFESAKKRVPILPISIIMKYKFETYKYVIDTEIPIAIFHGNKDNVVDYSNAIRMKQHLKPNDQVTILEDEGHYDFAPCEQYINELKELIK